MGLKENINEDIKKAMRAKDQGRLRALRSIKSAILLLETSEGRKEESLTAEEELKLLIKQAKQRKDSYNQYITNNREDLAKVEAEELAVIEEYLPKQLSESEVEEKVKAIIDQLGASSVKDLGKVMGTATKQLAGMADGKLISKVAKSLLN